MAKELYSYKINFEEKVNKYLSWFREQSEDDYKLVERFITKERLRKGIGESRIIKRCYILKNIRKFLNKPFSDLLPSLSEGVLQATGR